jgi:hypothetical protein
MPTALKGKADAGQVIERLYAWIATEPDGGEGLCAMRLGDTMMPLVGADRERIESLGPHAAIVARASGCPVRLVEFSTRRVLRDKVG